MSTHSFFLSGFTTHCLSAWAHMSTTASILLVLYTEQVLAHYRMINQLSATATCCQQMALEVYLGSALCHS